jgi:hypothetical protein
MYLNKMHPTRYNRVPLTNGSTPHQENPTKRTTTSTSDPSHMAVVWVGASGGSDLGLRAKENGGKDISYLIGYDI